MTEEQIKQNAEAYASYFYPRNSTVWQDRYNAYIAGAHSRDEEIRELLKDREKFYREKISALADAQELRNELDKLRNPWISVEERLPEGVQKVLFYHGESEGTGYYYSGCGLFYEEESTSYISKEQVQWWMPRPELKKGGKK